MDKTKIIRLALPLTLLGLGALSSGCGGGSGGDDNGDDTTRPRPVGRWSPAR